MPSDANSTICGKDADWWANGVDALKALDRLLEAARKIEDGEMAGTYPTHLGNCIGPLSDVKCRCGLTDLRYAIRAYDKASALEVEGWRR